MPKRSWGSRLLARLEFVALKKATYARHNHLSVLLNRTFACGPNLIDNLIDGLVDDLIDKG